MKKQIEELVTPPPHLTPDQIIQIRKQENVSQSAMAIYLGVNKKTVKNWEQGICTPSKTSLRLLQIVKIHGLKIIQSYA